MRRSNSVLNWSNVSSTADGRAPINIRADGRGSSRSASQSSDRSRRRSKLRVTAGPRARLNANATDAAPESGSGQ
jgi:hypothetical protein